MQLFTTRCYNRFIIVYSLNIVLRPSNDSYLATLTCASMKSNLILMSRDICLHPGSWIMKVVNSKWLLIKKPTAMANLGSVFLVESRPPIM
jgi:hypothetical protein